MFSLFNKQEQPTFKQRVERFWDWYAQAAPRLYQTIEDRKSASLATEVSEKVDELGHSFGWVFGPGEGDGHSFTLSGEGVLHYQLLTQYWLTRAPKIPGWTFYSERQPGSITGIRIKIGELDFDPIEFWLTPVVDSESEKIDLTVWHPLFDKLPGQNDKLRPLFLFLDEVLGEFGTEQWIGEINLNDKQLPDSIPLKELRGFIENLQKTKGWKKFRPGEQITLYRCESPHTRFLRGDILIGQAAQPSLIEEYLNAQGKLKDPLAGTGADYVFVSFPVGILPKGKQVDARGAIEDALHGALKTEQRGRLLGGALGSTFGYIDLLIYDGSSSVETIRRILREQNLPAGTAINFFAEGKQALSL